MKIDNRIFNYPVLAAGRDDYKSCEFKADYILNQNENSLMLNFSFDTNCREIKNLINGGKAEYLVHFECPATIFRTVLKSATPQCSFEINLSRVKSVIEIVAMIILKSDVKNFICRDWSEDFSDLNFNLSKGNVLAYKTLPSLKIPDSPDKFSNPESIFTVCRKVCEDSKFDVDFEGEKIQIHLSDAEYNFFVNANSNIELQPVVNSLIVFPALIYVLEELQDEGALEYYQYKEWFLSLKNHYPALVDEINNREDLFELAQNLMNLPLTRVFESLEKLYLEDEG